MSTPKIDDSSTFNRDANRRANFGMLNEVIDEGFANRLKGRINEAVRESAFAQSADFSRM
jgi:hypothetical protein